MRSNIIKILIGALIFWVWMVFARTYYICEIRGLCKPPEPTVDSTFLEKLPKTLSIKVGEDRILENYPEFYFDYSSTAVVYTDKHEQILSKLADLVKAQPKARLHIIGNYLQNEKTPELTRYANLGVARAMTIADKLLHEYKLPTDQLMTSGNMLKDTILQKPIRFELLGFMPDLDALREKEEQRFLAQFDSSLLYVNYSGLLGFFDPHRADLTIASALDTYSDSLRVFLEKKPKLKILLVGHSDIQLTDKAAEKAGLSYAKAMEKYLRKEGFENPINTKSKGKKEPLVNDLLPDGTADKLGLMKNRRVEIFINTSN